MKKLIYSFALMAVVSALATSPALSAENKNEQPTIKKGEVASSAESRISQKDAERRVLAKYPGAIMVSVDPKTVDGRSVWIASFTQTGASIVQKVQVDGESGKLTRL